VAFLKMAVKVIIAIPRIKSLFESLVDLYQQKKIEEIKSIKANVQNRRKALLSAIKGAKTDEERKELSILLHNHDTNRLPNN
jgi:hypothetical protein